MNGEYASSSLYTLEAVMTKLQIAYFYRVCIAFLGCALLLAKIDLSKINASSSELGPRHDMNREINFTIHTSVKRRLKGMCGV